MSTAKVVPTYHSGLYRFAFFLTVWSFLIVTVGATVKSHEAGLSIAEGFILHWIPDWWNRPNLKYEFFHRLLVPVLGIGAVALVGWILAVEKRPGVRRVSVAILLLILLQALIGILTVDRFAYPTTSIPHAVLGQSVFCLLACLTTSLSPLWMGSAAPIFEKESPSLRNLARATMIAIFVQLLLGAAVRHDHQSDAFLAGRTYVLYLHIGAHVLGAFAVAFFLVRLLFRVYRDYRNQPQIRTLAHHMSILFTLQLLLGIAAAILKVYYLLDERADFWVRNVPSPRVWTTTAHVGIGAMIMASAAVLWVRCYRYTVPLQAKMEASAPLRVTDQAEVSA